MSSPDFSSVSKNSWVSICSRVKNSVVFIDNGAAECLHWDGGLARLYDKGALDVKEFSSFESCPASHSKAVFILSTPLWRVALNVLQDIIRNSKINHCIVVTAADARVHTLLKYGSFESGSADRDPFARLQTQILEWMGNRNYAMEIIFTPIFFANICPAMFVTPPFSNMFPPLPRALSDSILCQSDRANAGDKKSGFQDDLQLGSLPLELQVSVAQFVANFNAAMELLNVRESYYSMGPFSRVLSTELEELPSAKPRRKMAQTKLSVLFIDRTLDLAQATSYDFETLLDRVLHILPKLPHHAMDVAVDISPLASVKIPEDYLECGVPLLVPGCLAHANDYISSAILNSMVTSKHKNCIMEINRHLVQAVSKQQLSEDSKLSRVTADTLLANVVKFKNNLPAIEAHLGVLQHTLATIQALQHPNNSKIDTLLGIEKALMQLLGEDGTSKLRIAQLIKERNARGLTLEEILILLTRLCTLRGKGFISLHDEQVDMQKVSKSPSLKEVLGDALLQDYDQLPDYVKSNIGPDVNELSIHAMVTRLFDALNAVSNAREYLKKYNSIFDPGSTTQPASYTPLMKQLLDDVFNPSKPDLVDLECRNTGLRDILKSGLGLFMSVTKPRPSDNQTILVYFIGGVTSTEVRQIQELVAAQKPTYQVLVGGTRIALPKDTLELLIDSQNDLKC